MSNFKVRFMISGLTALLAAGTLSAIAYGAAAQGKGNEGKGRYYFRQTCKTCHVKGAKGGEITPLSKSMAQWKSYFVKAKHSGGSEALVKVMSAEQLKDVETFLVAHAADSLQPETCGK